MGESFGLKSGPLVCENGEDIAGVLEGVAGERGESFDVADRGEPPASGEAESALPLLRDKGELRTVKAKCEEHANKQIMAAFQPVDDSCKAANGDRGRDAAGVERGAEANQKRSGIGLGLDDGEDLGEKPEILQACSMAPAAASTRRAWTRVTP